MLAGLGLILAVGLTVMLAGEVDFRTTGLGVAEGDALRLGDGCGCAGATLWVGVGDGGGLEGLDEKCEECE